MRYRKVSLQYEGRRQRNREKWKKRGEKTHRECNHSFSSSTRSCAASSISSLPTTFANNANLPPIKSQILKLSTRVTGGADGQCRAWVPLRKVCVSEGVRSRMERTCMRVAERLRCE